MDLDGLWRLDATAQAELLRTGELTPVELLERSIARIERLNPRVNAVVTPLCDEARRSIASIPPGAPFAGVPMLVKDASLQVEGAPYFLGTQILRDRGYRSRHTTELARRLRTAGLVFTGKTNVPALSSGVTTEPLAFGSTGNPWDLSRSAGGSSGGSAAAVACGLTAIAHGADAGGSLRYPAACCGAVTLKPTRGRVPSEAPVGPDEDGVWSEFVLARSVRDLAGVLDAVHGPSPHHTPSPPPPARSYIEEMSGDAAGMRVGLLTHDAMTGMSVDGECVAAVEGTAALLASLGHHVEESHAAALDGILVRIFPHLSTIIAASRAPMVRWLEAIAGRRLRDGDVEPGPLPAADAASPTAEQVAGARGAIDKAIAPIGDWWADHDLLVTPVLRQPPWPLGQTGGAADAGTFPFVFSLTGQPAISLPLHWTPTDLPIGVQIVAAHGRDDLLLNIAAQLERARPWADRWPAIAEATA